MRTNTYRDQNLRLDGAGRVLAICRLFRRFRFRIQQLAFDGRQVLQLLRVGALGEGREADEVGEQDGDLLSLTLEGVAAASWSYLGKPPSQLTRADAALLAVLPQAPSRLRPDRHPERAQAARDKVLRRLGEFQVWGWRGQKLRVDWPLI